MGKQKQDDQVVLDGDVVTEILVRLPVKSLMRFLCVSKTWCELITSPWFANRKKDHHRRIRFLLVKQTCSNESKPSLSFYSYNHHHNDEVLEEDYGGNIASRTPTGYINVAAPPWKLPISRMHDLIGTCNGIVCIGIVGSTNDNIYLCNPATRSLLKISPNPSDCLESNKNFCGISMGFGYDPSTKDYKIIKFVYYHSMEAVIRLLMVCEIYTLRMNCWRKLDFLDNYSLWKIHLCDKRATLLANGSLMHWIIYDHGLDCYGILSFNTSTEKFQKIEPPLDIPLNSSSASLAVLDDCLALFRVEKLNPDSGHQQSKTNIYQYSIDVWVMRDYGIQESWVKRCSIVSPSLVNTSIIMHNQFPYSSWIDHEILFQTRVLGKTYGPLISCSLQNNNEHQEIVTDGHYILPLDVEDAIVYEETLVSLF